MTFSIKVVGEHPLHPGVRCTEECYPGGVMIQGKPARLTDGYHTMEELYQHRRALTAALASALALGGNSWRSKAHHPDDDPMFDGGYFIVGIELPTGTITYHYKLTYWDDFAAVPEVEHAPKWDGADPNTTVTRLIGVARGMAVAQELEPILRPEAAAVKCPPTCGCRQG